jgi:hypothetical protein
MCEIIFLISQEGGTKGESQCKASMAITVRGRLWTCSSLKLNLISQNCQDGQHCRRDGSGSDIFKKLWVKINFFVESPCVVF